MPSAKGMVVAVSTRLQGNKSVTTVEVVIDAEADRRFEVADEVTLERDYHWRD